MLGVFGLSGCAFAHNGTSATTRHVMTWRVGQRANYVLMVVRLSYLPGPASEGPERRREEGSGAGLGRSHAHGPDHPALVPASPGDHHDGPEGTGQGRDGPGWLAHRRKLH